MPQYSFKSKNNKEIIKTTQASNRSESELIFSKIKVLPLIEFLELYEVIKK